jgi:hypothetical protein
MDWKEEPATEQQLLRLQKYGFEPTFPLTVTQAARLIRQYSKHPPRSTAETALSIQPVPVGAASAPSRSPGFAARPRAEDAPPGVQIRPGRLSESAQMHVYQLRLAVLAAERSVREVPDRPGVRADLHAITAARRQFWLDTCRDNNEVLGAPEQALEFYQLFGARYFTPTWSEVGEVLDALDLAMPGWDKDHPELFYETLKLNFPSLLRHK